MTIRRKRQQEPGESAMSTTEQLVLQTLRKGGRVEHWRTGRQDNLVCYDAQNNVVALATAGFMESLFTRGIVRRAFSIMPGQPVANEPAAVPTNPEPSADPLQAKLPLDADELYATS